MTLIRLRFLHLTRIKDIYVCIILAVLCILSVCYNSLLTYCLVANRKREWARKAKQLFYLVLSDLFASIVLIPRTIFSQLNISRRTYEMCAPLNFTLVTTQTVAFYHVFSMCIHRYLHILRAHLPSSADKYRYDLESFIIWIALMLICTPPFFCWGRQFEVLTGCGFKDLYGPSDRPAMAYMLVVLCVPLFLTNAVYVTMVLKMIYTGRVQPTSGFPSHCENIGEQTTANRRTEIVSTRWEKPCSHQSTKIAISVTKDTHVNDTKDQFSCSNQSTRTPLSATCINDTNVNDTTKHSSCSSQSTRIPLSP